MLEFDEDDDDDELLICVELDVVVLVEVDPGAPLCELDELDEEDDELDPDVLPIAPPSSFAMNSSM